MAEPSMPPRSRPWKAPIRLCRAIPSPARATCTASSSAPRTSPRSSATTCCARGCATRCCTARAWCAGWTSSSVSTADPPVTELRCTPGLAIDALGREIFVPETVCLDITGPRRQHEFLAEPVGAAGRCGGEHGETLLRGAELSRLPVGPGAGDRAALHRCRQCVGLQPGAGFLSALPGSRRTAGPQSAVARLAGVDRATRDARPAAGADVPESDAEAGRSRTALVGDAGREGVACRRRSGAGRHAGDQHQGGRHRHHRPGVAAGRADRGADRHRHPSGRASDRRPLHRRQRRRQPRAPERMPTRWR